MSRMRRLKFDVKQMVYERSPLGRSSPVVVVPASVDARLTIIDSSNANGINVGSSKLVGFPLKKKLFIKIMNTQCVYRFVHDFRLGGGGNISCNSNDECNDDEAPVVSIVFFVLLLRRHPNVARFRAKLPPLDHGTSESRRLSSVKGVFKMQKTNCVSSMSFLIFVEEHAIMVRRFHSLRLPHLRQLYFRRKMVSVVFLAMAIDYLKSMFTRFKSSIRTLNLFQL